MSQNICPSCGNANESEALFCMKCGTKLITETQVFCSRCGTALESSAAFCIRCGSPVPTSQPPQVAPTQNGDDTDTEPSFVQQLDAMQPGDTMMRYGHEFTKDERGMLQRSDENGRTYVDAASFFVAQQRERKQMQQKNNLSTEEEVQPLWDPTVTEEPSLQPRAMHQMNGTPAPTTTQQHFPSPIDNEEDALDDDEVEAMDPLSYLAKLNAPPPDPEFEEDEGLEEDEYEDEDEDEDEGRKRSDDELEKFQEIANYDGYYDDREPIDKDVDFGGKNKVQWASTLLAIAGIILFVIVAMSLRGVLF